VSKYPIVLGLLIAATPLSAAEKGRVGLVARPWSVTELGVTWHVSEKVALRPAIGLGLGSTRDTPTALECQAADFDCTDTTVDWSNLSGAVDVLRYLGTNDAFTPYLAFGVDYRHSRNSDSIYPDETFDAVRPSLRLGLQHPFSERVSVFGEAGVQSGWNRRKRLDSDRVPGWNRTSWSVSTFVASAGLVLYLN
jgi:opacity protein-like surface antigen